MDHLLGPLYDFNESAEHTSQLISELNSQWSAMHGGAVAAGNAVGTAGNQISKTGDQVTALSTKIQNAHKKMRDFTSSALSDWKSNLLSVTSYQKGFSITADKFAGDLEGMRKKMHIFAGDMAALKQQDWVPDKFKAWLVQQGPDAIHAFETSSKDNQRNEVSNWTSIQASVRRGQGLAAGRGSRSTRCPTHIPPSPSNTRSPAWTHAPSRDSAQGPRA